MNAIEIKLQDCWPRWVHYHRGYSTVVNGYGWIVFEYKDRMWLACVTPQVVQSQLKIHEPKDENTIVYCTQGSASHPAIDLCFKVPASDAFLAEVAKSAHEGIFTDFYNQKD